MSPRDDQRQVAHLLRRAGFGLLPVEVEAVLRGGFHKAVDAMIDGLVQPPPVDPSGFDPYEPGAIQRRWLERMLGGQAPLAEKLALFWHGNLATSNVKLRESKLMWTQYQLFRSKGAGAFEEFIQAITKDVAMIRWLDQNSNRKGVANENYARELMELFTLGIGNYTETDVREAARAFTGYGSEGDRAVFTAAFHDDGEKTVLGQKGRFHAEDVVHILTSLPRCAEYICTKLVKFFACPDPKPEEIAPLQDVWVKNRGDIKSVLAALFRSPFFVSARCENRLIRGPVEFLIAALRAAGIEALPDWTVASLTGMGQTLFQPPSVKGWTGGTSWLSSGGMVERLKAADRIAELTKTDATAVVAAAFGGALPENLRSALAASSGRDQIRLALASPDFQAN